MAGSRMPGKGEGGSSVGAATVGMRLDDRALKAGFKGVIKNLGAVAKEADRASGSMKRGNVNMLMGFARVHDAVGRLRMMFRGAAQMAEKLYAVAAANAAGNNVAAVFDSMGYSVDRFRAATKGMINDRDLQKGMNAASLLGLSGDEFTKLMNTSAAAARRTGESQQKMFDKIVKGVTSSNAASLRGIGFTISWKKAHEDFAKSVGKSVDKLTEQEKKQAELNQVLQEGEDLTKEIGWAGADAGDAYKQFGVQWDNLKTKMGSFIAKEGAELVTWLTSVFEAINKIDLSKLNKFFGANAGERGLVPGSPEWQEARKETRGERLKNHPNMPRLEFSMKDGVSFKGDLAKFAASFLETNGEEKSLAKQDELTAGIKALEKEMEAAGSLEKQRIAMDISNAKSALAAFKNSMSAKKPFQSGGEGKAKIEAEKKRKEAERLAREEARELKRQIAIRTRLVANIHKMSAAMRDAIDATKEVTLATRVASLFQEEAERDKAIWKMLPAGGSEADGEKRNRMLDQSETLMKAQAVEMLKGTTSLKDFNQTLDEVVKQAATWNMDLDRQDLSDGAKTKRLMHNLNAGKYAQWATDSEPEGDGKAWDRKEAARKEREAEALRARITVDGNRMGNAAVMTGLQTGFDPLSMMMAAASAFDPVVGMIVNAVVEGLSLVGDAFIEVVKFLLLDDRLGNAAQSGMQAGAGAVTGVAIGGVLLAIVASIATPILILAAIFWPITIAATALALGFAFIVTVVVGLLSIIPLLLAGFVGMYVAIFELSKSSEGFQRFNDAIGYLTDGVISATGPLWDNMTAVVGLFDGFTRVLGALIAAMVSSEPLMWVLFNAFHFAGTVMLGFVSMVIGMNNIIMNVLAFITGLIPGMAALAATFSTAAIDASNFDRQFRAFQEMTYAEADARGESTMGILAETEARDDLANGSFNMPSGYRTAGPIFDAQDPSIGTQGQGSTINWYGNLEMTAMSGDEIQQNIANYFRGVGGRAYNGNGRPR